MREYRFKPPHASDGKQFANLCIELHKKLLGQVLHECTSRSDQCLVGDAFGNVEFKELKKSKHRLHIEIAENNDREHWFPSGIYAPNRRWYVCGNDNDIWGFGVDVLIKWHQEQRPEEVWYGQDIAGNWRLGIVDDPGLKATIQSAVLPKETAQTLFAYRFALCGKWILLKPGVELMRHRPPTLDDLIKRFYGYANITAEGWQQYYREMAEYNALRLVPSFES